MLADPVILSNILLLRSKFIGSRLCIDVITKLGMKVGMSVDTANPWSNDSDLDNSYLLLFISTICLSWELG